MKNILRFLAFVLMVGGSYAQINLPACGGRDQTKWSNCVGSMNFPSGKYVGELKDGKRSGQGSFNFANGDLFIGGYKDDKFHGQGTYSFANGGKFDGEFKDGKANGQGTLIFSNGDKYVGEFEDDKRNGQGTFTFADGRRYVGEWKNDKGNGQAEYVYGNGYKYIGEFKDSMRHGQGAFYATNGSVISQGIWADDKLVRSAPIKQENVTNQTLPTDALIPNTSQSNLPACPSGDKKRITDCWGRFVYPLGAIWVGEIKGGSPNGEGILYSSEGKVLESGIVNGTNLISSYKIDLARYPFEILGSVQSNLPSTVSLAQPGSSERDRLLAEVESERRKRQELEDQIKVAQQPNKQPATSIIERRVALVIGNAAYKVNPLKNPVNDSTDMARSLRSVGFDVIEANNTTLAQMREVTRRFADKLGNSDVGLVYYSGHGVEVKGKNYLIPVNADIKREYEVVDQAFDASQFLEMMDNIRGPNNKRVNILIVDACRNNELQKSWRSTNNGLARMDAPGGTFISFATAPGRVAADGTGRNSPYTKHLLQALKQPNVPIEQVFKVVRRNVMEETKGEQIPWENSSLVGDFYFTVAR